MAVLAAVAADVPRVSADRRRFFAVLSSPGFCGDGSLTGDDVVVFGASAAVACDGCFESVLDGTDEEDD